MGLFVASSRSLMMIIKCLGVNSDPCGTPALILGKLGECQSTETYIYRPERNLEVHCQSFGDISSSKRRKRKQNTCILRYSVNSTENMYSNPYPQKPQPGRSNSEVSMTETKNNTAVAAIGE